MCSIYELTLFTKMGNLVAKRDTSFEAQHCTPLGLYKNSKWDPKLLKKLIVDKKLAPIFKGTDDKVSYDHEECPICFLFYPGGLNRTRCCRQSICTECYLQLKTPNIPATCPFCNRQRFAIAFLGPKTQEEKAQEEKERQKVLELQARMRKEEAALELKKLASANADPSNAANADSSNAANADPSNATGHLQSQTDAPNNSNTDVDVNNPERTQQEEENDCVSHDEDHTHSQEAQNDRQERSSSSSASSPPFASQPLNSEPQSVATLPPDVPELNYDTPNSLAALLNFARDLPPEEIEDLMVAAAIRLSLAEASQRQNTSDSS